MQQRPLHESIKQLQQETEQIPVLVNLFQQAQGQKKLLAAKLLHDATGSSELIPELEKALWDDQEAVAPVDILAELWRLQMDHQFLAEPTRRLHVAQMKIIRYLAGAGILKYAPQIEVRAWQTQLAGCQTIAQTIDFFNRFYPYWRRIQWAIEDGYIQHPIDFYRWQRSKRLKFRWGKRSLIERATKLPPRRPSGIDYDAERQVSVFMPRAQMMVRRGEQ